MKTLKEIGIEIGFETKAKNYRKVFYDKYIRNLDYKIICEHYDLISIFDLSNKLDWNYISNYQKLSESFMREFQDKLNWLSICIYQKLSESFMREFSDKLYWIYISEFQKLSESFIREFGHKLTWYYISQYQKLSESFMKEFSDKLDWSSISKHQKLSESFVREFQDLLKYNPNLIYLISKYQYDDNKQFEHSLDDLSLYEIIDGYVYGYKAVRSDRYSLYNFQYLYEDGSIHESFSDQTDDENSFGLSIGTKKFANDYGNSNNYQYILLYVRTKISDITRIVHKGQKLRSRRIEILNEVEK